MSDSIALWHAEHVIFAKLLDLLDEQKLALARRRCRPWRQIPASVMLQPSFAALLRSRLS